MKRAKIIMMLAVIAVGIAGAQAQKQIQSVVAGYQHDNAFVEVLRYECSYDESGKLQSVLARQNRGMLGSSARYAGPEYFDTALYTLQWMPEMLYVQVMPSTLFPGKGKTMSITLNTAGNADVMVYDGDVSRFSYDASGRMTDWKTVFEDGKEKNCDFSYFNGDITKMAIPEEQITVNYAYMDKAGKIGFQLPFLHFLSGRIVYNNALAVNMGGNPVLLLAGITGKPCEKLVQTAQWRYPTQEGDRFVTKNGSYSYEYDQEGYVTKVICDDFVYPNMNINISYIGTDGVDGVSADAAGSFVVDGRCVTSTIAGTLSAYDLQGRLVVSSQSGCVELPAAGIYLLRAGTKTMKVAVR